MHVSYAKTFVEFHRTAFGAPAVDRRFQSLLKAIATAALSGKESIVVRCDGDQLDVRTLVTGKLTTLGYGACTGVRKVAWSEINEEDVLVKYEADLLCYIVWWDR